MAEIRLVIVRMLWKFDWELCEEIGSDLAEQRAWSTWRRETMNLVYEGSS